MMRARDIVAARHPNASERAGESYTNLLASLIDYVVTNVFVFFPRFELCRYFHWFAFHKVMVSPMHLFRSCPAVFPASKPLRGELFNQIPHFDLIIAFDQHRPFSRLDQQRFVMCFI